MQINPLQVVLWSFRRRENDVVNLYNSLTGVMQLATGGHMLNFGYWEGADTPISAQRRMCMLVSDMAELGSAKRLADIGSGLSAPALEWNDAYRQLDTSCININFSQLSYASKLMNDKNAPSLINATATALPFSDKSVDRIIALESAQHFKPFDLFVKECKRVLADDGLFVAAIPVMTLASKSMEIRRLGILTFTWSSERYPIEYVTSAITENGFEIKEAKRIGHQVYEPLADYYVKNRKEIRDRILKEYPRYLEQVLYKSLLKMKQVSEKQVIDYLVVKCSLQ